MYKLYMPAGKRTFYAEKIFYKNGFINLIGNVREYHHERYGDKFDKKPDMSFHGIQCIRTKIDKIK